MRAVTPLAKTVWPVSRLRSRNMPEEPNFAGTEGTLRCTPHRYWFRRASDTDPQGDGPAETRDFTEHPLESHVREMEAFGEAVRTGLPPETDGWAGLQALAVVEALQYSAETGKPQRVPSFVQRKA